MIIIFTGKYANPDALYSDLLKNFCAIISNYLFFIGENWISMLYRHLYNDLWVTFDNYLEPQFLEGNYQRE